jgi:hypothetical protein
VAELLGLTLGKRQDLLGPWRKVIHGEFEVVVACH